MNTIQKDVQLMGQVTQCINSTNYVSTKHSGKRIFGKVVTLLMFVLFSANVFSQSNWVGTTNSNWFTAGNWSGGVPTASSNVTISSGAANMPVINAAGAVCKNITVNSGTTLTMNSAGELNVSGNWKNDGNFKAGGGVVIFSGSMAQGLSGATTYDNLFVNNTSGVSLDNSIIVKSTLKFDHGNIITGINTVTVDTNGISVPIGGFVEGNLKQFVHVGFGVSVWYTVGTGSDFTPFEFIFDNVFNAGYITAKAVKGDHPLIGTSGLNDTLTVNRYWSLTNSGVVFDQYNAGIQYVVSDKDRSFTDTLATLQLFSGGTWTNFPNGANSINLQSTSNITSIGDIQIGQINTLQNLYTITPVFGAKGQTLNIMVHGTGFLTNVPALNFGPDITVNSTAINSDFLITVNITILPTAALGSRSFNIYNPLVAGGNSIVDFTVTPALPVAGLSSTSSVINCYAIGATTFNNSSSNATSYNWDFGSGASPAIATGFGPYTVNYSSTGLKTVKLIATNESGSDTLVRTNYITVNGISPMAPASISGPLQVCPLLGTDVIYTCPTAIDVTAYNWTIPAGTTVVSGQGTTGLTIHYLSSGFTTGNITVSSSNGCGVSSPMVISPSVLLPTPGVITGPTAVCGLATALYSVTPVLGATSYLWTVPAGISITSGQGTTALHATISSGTINGTITVSATNPACGASALSSLLITKKPQAPSAIQGPVSLCGQTTAVYSVPSTLGTTSYTWAVPAGITITSGSGTNTINVSIASTFATGQMLVTAVNSCGSVAGTSLNIYGKIPTTPSSVTGPVSICGLSTATYTAAATSGAASYIWTLPTGLSIVSGTGTNSITLSNTGFVSGSISVAGINGCGTGITKALVLNVNAATPGIVTGPVITCGLTTAAYSISSVPGALTNGYTWVIPAGGSVSSGQGTTSIVATFTTPPTGNITVTSDNGCANSAARILNVSKVPTMPGAVTGPTVVCGMTTANYSIAAVSGATSYFWVVPTGMTIALGQGTTNIIVNVPLHLTSGLLRVYSQTSCGNSTYSGITIGACANEIEMNSEEKENTFSSVYPNPATSEIDIDITTSEVSKDVVVELYDILGNLLIREKHEIGSGVSILKTNIEQYNTGIYFVKLLDSNSNTIYTQKIIKH